MAAWLRSRGIEVAAYTGKIGPDRVALEQALLNDDVKALIATSALGMGFDKPDLAFVIHYEAPGSVVAYYQQVGRAGRALEAARGVLLSGEEETEITGYFIRSAFPTRNEVEQVLAALEADDEGLTQNQIETKVNVSSGRIQKTLQLLSLESPPPIVRQGSSWQLTAASLSDDFWKRAERLTDLRRKEQAEMQEYVQLSSGHMAFLIRALTGQSRQAARWAVLERTGRCVRGVVAQVASGPATHLGRRHSVAAESASRARFCMSASCRAESAVQPCSAEEGHATGTKDDGEQ